MTSLFFLMTAPFSAQAAVPVYYNDRATFEAATNPGFIIDDYADPGYVFVQSDAAMSNVVGETDYMTTGFNNNNIISGATYCAGCNGSFQMSFLTTSFSVPGPGVTNIGLDVVGNDQNLPYHAYLEFGDGTFEDHPLPAGASFFGVVENQNGVVGIHMGLANGATTQAGSFQIDNLTLGEGCSGLTPDSDGDGIEDLCDNCPNDVNDYQDDADSGGIGDICDSCPDDPQNDADGDGVCGDLDPCPFDSPDDTDGDGVCDRDDRCEGFDDALDADADGFPDDCDDCPNTPQPGLRDDDADGYGLACDCADDDPAIHPDADEVCDGIDNDCDEDIDEDAVDASIWYLDSDSDGEGNAADSVLDCSAPNGRVANTLDCDDSDAGINTVATEICDSVDNNCDGQVDEGLTDCVDAGDAKAPGTGCSCDTTTSPGGVAWLVFLGGALLRRRRSAEGAPNF